MATLVDMKERLESVGSNGIRFGKYLFEKFIEDQCTETASALTYQTMFAVVPLLTVAYLLINSVPAMSGLDKQIEDFIFTNIVPENVGVIREYLTEFSTQARGLGAVSFAFLGFTAFWMLMTTEKTFNRIWHVNEPRHGYQRWLMYWAVLTFGPLVFIAGIVITGYVLSLPYVIDVASSSYFLWIVPLTLNTSVFTLVYVTVPNCHVPLRHAVKGGFLVAVATEAAKYSFGFFVSRTSFEDIYGAFATFPLFLIWVYMTWTIVLMGAEVVKSVSVYRSDKAHVMEPHLFQMLVLLERFFHAHRVGEVVRESDITSGSLRIDLEHWTEYKTRLLELRLIQSVGSGYVLSRDLSEVTVWDLYRNLPWPLPRTAAKGDALWETTLSEVLLGLAESGRAQLDIDIESLLRGRAYAIRSAGKPDVLPGESGQSAVAPVLLSGQPDPEGDSTPAPTHRGAKG